MDIIIPIFKSVCRRLGAGSEFGGGNQFGAGIEREPEPDFVTFVPQGGPQYIELHVTHLQVAHLLGMQVLAVLSWLKTLSVPVNVAFCDSSSQLVIMVQPI